jgi:glycosyltransferase involved in cell wall biosynthesis
MRILLVSSSSGSRGGGELFLLYLAEALKTAGHEPVLWCASHPRMDELAQRFGAFGPVLRDPYPNSYLDRRFRVISAVRDRGLIDRLTKRFAEIPCDVIHLNKQTLEDGLDLMAALRGSVKPLVCTIHITQTSRSLGATGGRLRDFVAIRNLRRAKDIYWTAVSDSRALELGRVLGRKIPATYNAVTEGSVQERSVIRKELLAVRGWPENSVVVVCVGRLVAQKNPERFLRMAASLFQIEPACRFLWIGGGEEQAGFLEQAVGHGLSGNVDCTGWLLEPRRLLAGADLYLHPARYEGLPLAILEAMAAGLPCVLSEEITSEMDLFDSETVIIAREGDNTWSALAASSAARARYAVASSKLYQSHFRIEVMANAYLKLYALSMAGIKQ